MVIGKVAEMYEELFEYFFRTAAANGLLAPRVAGSAGADSRARAGRVPFVSATMDFETAQHLGFFGGLARVFGGQPSDYHGRAIGCGVHFKRFLLKPCGNDLRDPFYTRMVYLRESDEERGLPDVRRELSTMAADYQNQGENKKANIIKWLLKNEAALMAAFPRSTGMLDKFELLASHHDTNSCESLNRQTKQVVAKKSASTLLEVVSALSDFDHRTMAGLTTAGLPTPVGASQTARMNRSATRKRRTNAVPVAGQPPKTARPRRERGKSADAATAARAASEGQGQSKTAAEGGVPSVETGGGPLAATGGGGTPAAAAGEGASVVVGGGWISAAVAGGGASAAAAGGGASAAAAGGGASAAAAGGGAPAAAGSVAVSTASAMPTVTAATTPAAVPSTLSLELFAEFQLFLAARAQAAAARDGTL
ncbi:hypothetical protein BU14_0148s0041 [Porphyra umbilicalis]|uniref:Uncharacterized protein n=1 Tax=Porphyra umbilicalis TaxID=2786 RepID=A0A1X6P9R4_PORUM|nr:hypothetical protein BU14_0148s0041 [Porphyra umbilicalis]|eukprot:OSX77465.1 hypothetical protein BU14_0148s0041 [Porphyra umbilicalis]